MLKKRDMKILAKRIVGTTLAAALIASTVTMGNVEAKKKKSNPVIKYCQASGVEFWYHENGYGDDEPILYLKKNAKLRHWTGARLTNREQAFCTYIKWDRDGYMDVHYLSTHRATGK